MAAMIRRLALLATPLLLVPSQLGSATAQISHFHRPLIAVGANKSNNWSGYNQGTIEKSGTMFHQVSGDWAVPTATAHKRGEAEYSATWVGIGGGCVDALCLVTDSTLIQAGTEQDVNSGLAPYSAWWEIIPGPAVTISNMAVKAGDQMHVDITESPVNANLWTITVQNKSTGATFKQTIPYSSTHLTAEWIEETPVVLDTKGNVSVGPLPDLSKVAITSADANGSGAGLISPEAIQLVDFNLNPLATPSAPLSGGTAFDVCTYSSSCT